MLCLCIYDVAGEEKKRTHALIVFITCFDVPVYLCGEKVLLNTCRMLSEYLPMHISPMHVIYGCGLVEPLSQSRVHKRLVVVKARWRVDALTHRTAEGLHVIGGYAKK